jgi:hypothetical protein
VEIKKHSAGSPEFQVNTQALEEKEQQNTSSAPNVRTHGARLLEVKEFAKIQTSF